MGAEVRKPRVLLADDHLILLEGLRQLLEEEFEIVGTVTDGFTMVKTGRQLRPDVIIFDISMPGLNGIDAARQVRKFDSHIKLVALTMHSDAGFLHEALDAGADAYLVKQSAREELTAAVHAVLSGEKYVGATLRAMLVDKRRADGETGRRPQRRLSQRQREVLQLLAEGNSMKDIAFRLGFTVKAAEYHKYVLMRKLGVRTVAELTLYAVKHGFVQPG